jgi:hypothetical protein
MTVRFQCDSRPSPIGGGRLLCAARVAIALAVLACAALGRSPAPRPPAVPLATQPHDEDGVTALLPPGARPFAAGVWIDWSARRVLVASHVVLRSGPLEFVACLGGKEHESILRLDATATHLYMALGLLGVEAGHPPVWDADTGRYDDPAGDLLDLTARWRAAGATRRASVYDWLREVQFDRPPIPRPWIFAGSLRRDDRTLAADHTGVGIALVDFPDSLICFSRRYPSRYGALWAGPATPEIPPLDTPVLLEIAPAGPLRPRLAIDPLGQARVDGRTCTPADFIDLVRLMRAQDDQRVIEIDVSGGLASDLARWRARLAACGFDDAAVRWIPADQPPASPEGS